MTKRALPSVLLLILLSCTDHPSDAPDPVALKVSLDSFTRIEVSTLGLHEYSAQTYDKSRDTIMFCQLDASDTAISSIADSIVGSRIYFNDYIYTSQGSGWESRRTEYKQSCDFALDSSSRSATLTVNVSDNIIEQWRTGARVRTAAYYLEVDSLRLISASPDSAMFECLLSKARSIGYSHEDKTNTYLEDGLTYKTSIDQPVVRVVLRR